MPMPGDIITVRPIRYEEITDGRPVYYLRDWAGALSLDPAILRDTKTYDIRGGQSWEKDQPIVGERVEAQVRTVYGTQTSVSLFSTAEAFDVKNPGNRFPEDRRKALARQARPGIYVEDPDGDESLPITPQWGAQAYVTVLVPDVDPADLHAAIEQVLTEKFPGARFPKLQTRPVADRRINVYTQDYSTVTWSNGQPTEPRRSPKALHVLEAEGYALLSSEGGNLTERIHPDVPRPVVGG